ncbi:MCE family protein [Mycobacterium intracellulare]|uniref:MCE family protein n=1 Tax=Mycobacterium intracellulare TaxID=1767 RepID=UPI001CDAA4F7|nr:MCE family protein [Mycobacterium intracellulare]MCA2255986.1 MCE family protein [Mycobacterium intracellulare]
MVGKFRPRRPPYRRAALLLALVTAAALMVVYLQFRGAFVAHTSLTLIADRSGLSLDTGAKVTLNGVQIGRVASIEELNSGAEPQARLTVDVRPRYLDLLPANVQANISASTVFGPKYVEFSSPSKPDSRSVTSGQVIHVAAVTTEVNTVFETVLQIAERVDPVKLSATLSAAAQGLNGLGTRFGRALDNGNDILADLNPQMPQIRHDTQQLAKLADIYTAGAPHFWDALEHLATTTRTLNDQRRELDAALGAAIGLGNLGADVLEKSSPYLVRGAADLVPSAQLADEYSPEIFCVTRKLTEEDVKARQSNTGSYVKGRGFAPGNENPYVYPDNLPRVNAKGGPEGQPGCWQTITRDLWPAPYLVMDTGASIAPYNHLAFGQPLLSDYVWGRQIGEYTINP